MIRLRFLLPYGNYRKGAVIEPPAMLRQQYLALRFIGRPVVEVVEEEKKAPPEPIAAPAAAPPRRRQRVSV